MSSISSILLLLVITSAALFVVNLINQHQIRLRLLKQKLATMKRKMGEVEELSTAIESLVENARIPLVINDEIIAMLESMLKISPENNVFQIALDNAIARGESLRSGGNSAQVFRLMESDASLARSHFMISEAARIVRKQHAQNKLQAAEMELLITDLAWADFMVKVTSHIGQGHKALGSGDEMRAFAYYKKALEIATSEKHKDDRQNRLISEIGDILNKKRSALSTNIMPETLYNPEAVSKAE